MSRIHYIILYSAKRCVEIFPGPVGATAIPRVSMEIHFIRDTCCVLPVCHEENISYVTRAPMFLSQPHFREK